ncbi:MAG: GNAT family N-acetyltransferase [Firmicutes bacterium]|nr:GNAT family N-acetyltransferase [Bacillota bacterium]
MTIRKLTTNDKKSYLSLFNEVKAGIDPLWFMPDEAEMIEFLGQKECTILGAFSKDGELMGYAAILAVSPEIEDVKQMFGKTGAVCEVGLAMVLPKFRPQLPIARIYRDLLEWARSVGFETLIATAHPDNRASCKLCEYAGMKLVATKMLGKYLRNFYTLEL